jgi:hypothetical protein
MSDEEPYGTKSYDLTEAGEQKVEDDAPRNPDPNFNPDVNEDDHEPETKDDTPGDQQVIVTGRPVVESEEPKPLETEDVATDFYVAQKLDERRLVPGTSPYWDDVERERAEIQRAKIEGREPDLENPPPTQGTPLYTPERARTAGLSTEYVEPDFTVDVPVVVG